MNKIIIQNLFWNFSQNNELGTKRLTYGIRKRLFEKILEKMAFENRQKGISTGKHGTRRVNPWFPLHTPPSPKATGLSSARGKGRHGAELDSGCIGPINAGAPAKADGRDKKSELGVLKKILGTGSTVAGALLISSIHRPLVEGILKDLGLEDNLIASCIISATDSQGWIHLDKLWREAENLLSRDNSNGSGATINKSYMPKVALALVRAGIKPEELRSALDKYVKSKTEVKVKDLSTIVNDLLPGLDFDQGDTMALIRTLGIPLESEDSREALKDGVLDESVRVMAEEGRGEKDEQALKQRVAKALQEKGFTVEKIKKMLEGLRLESISGALEEENTPKGFNRKIGMLIDNLKIDSKETKTQPKLKSSNHLIKQKSTGQMATFGEGEKRKVRPAGIQKEVVRPKRPEGRDAGGFDKSIFSGLKVANSKSSEKDNASSSGLTGLSLDTPHLENFMTGGIHFMSGDNSKWPISAQPYYKVFEHIKWMLSVGKHEGRLLLHPPELGQVALRVLVKQGHLRIELGTEHPWVKEVVQASLGDLKNQLSQAGFVVDQLEVTVGLGGSSSQDNQDNRAQDRSSDTPVFIEGTGDIMQKEIKRTSRSYQAEYQISIIV